MLFFRITKNEIWGKICLTVMKNVKVKILPKINEENYYYYYYYNNTYL